VFHCNSENKPKNGNLRVVIPAIYLNGYSGGQAKGMISCKRE
jgi:uncharacterized alpha/beta hydrolase family protein